jgi:dipeptidyl aminopeptidase/acylaminoacyl peptidase
VNAAGARVVTRVVRFQSPAGPTTRRADVSSPLPAETASVSPPRATGAIDLIATLYEPTFDETGRTVPHAPRSLIALIVGHGAGSRRVHHDRFARTACAAGMVVIALDFRGHGDSGGVLDGPGELDLVAAAAYLRGLDAVDPERICYRGSSLGGYFGLQAARAAGFVAMALVCPATEAVMLGSLDDAWDEGKARDRGLELRADVDALRAYFSAHDVRTTAARIDSDVLLVHARGDTVVPLESSLELAGCLRGRTDLVILPGGDHSSAQGSEAIDRLTVGWLRAHSARGRAAPSSGLIPGRPSGPP